MEYKPTIGLEIHAELKTRTKMFCDSPNDPDEKHPNVNVCPVCLAHPGALPTINKQAVAAVIRTGLALRGQVNPVSKFDRKNYFYPDLPKGYQISQYDLPLISGGTLRGVRIRRIHLEEDTGTLIHDDAGKASLVDFNRAGVPLMELVTEPDLASAEEVVAFARELQLILRYLGVSDADMEKGQLRVEANVSLNMGTKVELKNINSFRAVRDAIAYELARQEEALKKGEKVKQETRGWDEAKQRTESQRSKEEAHDYRYFPEPDLPPFETSVFEPELLARELPELPAAKRERFAKEYGFDPAADALKFYVEHKPWADYFEEIVSESDANFAEFGDQGKLKRGVVTAEDERRERFARLGLITNYLTSDLVGLMNKAGIGIADLKIRPEHLAHLVDMLIDGVITSRQAKDMLALMVRGDEDPEDILADERWRTVSDSGELEAVVKQVIAENPNAVADYKKGKKESMQFLIGKVMQKTKGRAKPEETKDILVKYLI